MQCCNIRHFYFIKIVDRDVNRYRQFDVMPECWKSFSVNIKSVFLYNAFMNYAL